MAIIFRRYQAPALKQKMFDPQEDTLEPQQPPFTNVGMDYLVPFSKSWANDTE